MNRLPLLLTLLLIGSMSLDAMGVEASTAADAGSTSGTRLGSSVGGAVVGINGHYRVGRMTSIRITEPMDLDGQVSLETLDGDGIRVRYQCDVRDASQELGYVIPGSEAAPLEIRVDDGNKWTTKVRTRFPEAGNPSLGPSMIPPAMPWVVCIGDTLGIESIGTSNVLKDKLSRIAVSAIRSADHLPHQQFGYDGVDLVLINGAGLSVLQSMDSSQSRALVDWIRFGGRCLLMLGESTGPMMEAAPWLGELLPMDDFDVVRYDPAAFETFTSSQTPLDVFSGVRLPRRMGRAILLGRTTRRVSANLIADYVVGIGHVTVITADLEHAQFSQWPERLALISQAVGDLFEAQDNRGQTKDTATTFQDLAGQMRGVLDQFKIKQSFSFSAISLLVLMLIAAIGPLDYLLINRVIGRPLLGWVTFPVVAVALSWFLISAAGPASDTVNADEASMDSGRQSRSLPLVRSNQFQLTDIDFVDGVGRAFFWSSVYTHQPVKIDVNVKPSPDAERFMDRAGGLWKTVSFPFGYPGKVFGGIQLASENNLLLPYSVNLNATDAERSPQVEQIDDLTIAPRSSKSIASHIFFQANLASIKPVIRRPGSDLLRGEFVNPLPIDVLDGMLIYRNTAYLLPTRVPAGSSIPAVEDLRQRNFRWRLTRKVTADENATESTPWAAGDFSNMGRVADMLMFHEAAGGKTYTSLRHDALGMLDLSNVLSEDRCLLIAQTTEPLLRMEISDQTTDDMPLTPAGNVLSRVRVVLPVRTTLLNQ